MEKKIPDMTNISLQRNLIKKSQEIFLKAKLATKNDIADFLKKTIFDEKLKEINKEVTTNKTKHVAAEKILTDLTKKSRNVRKKI